MVQRFDRCFTGNRTRTPLGAGSGRRGAGITYGVQGIAVQNASIACKC